jgi:3-oxoadipate CoA-transferase alpha subunit
MAMAARTTIVQTEEYVPAGEIDPETIVTPALYVSRIIEVRTPLQESALVADGVRYP